MTEQTSQAWERLASEYPKHLNDSHDAFYALPPELIDLFDEQFPDLIDVQFEREFSESGGVGFFCKHAFSYLNKGRFGNTNQSTRDRKRERELFFLAMEGLERMGMTDEQIDEHFNLQERHAQRFAGWAKAYAGWLVSNGSFRRDVRELWESCQHVIRKKQIFPARPFSFMGERPTRENIEAVGEESYHKVIGLYDRWGLNSMATLELPVPVRPELTLPSFHWLPSMTRTGVLLFVPYYLMRDEKTTVTDVVSKSGVSQIPNELHPWVNGDLEGYSMERLGVMLELYIYLELALKRRYPERIRGRLEKLDLAFGRFFYPDSTEVLPGKESVRKIRLHLQRHLRSSDVDSRLSDD